MRTRRAGHGCSSGVMPLAGRCVRPPELPPLSHLATLGDLPCAAAAIDRVRLDVRAYEQTEAYWRAVWGEPTTDERNPT